IVDKGDSFTSGILTKEAFVHILIIVAAIYIFALSLKVIFKFIEHYLINKFETNLIIDLKVRFFNHLVSLSHKFHVSHSTGSLISRLGRGSRAIEKMSDIIIFNVAPLIFQLAIVAITIIYFDLLSGLILIIAAIVFIIFSYISHRMQEESSLKANDAEDNEKALVADIFTNIDSVKYFGKESYIKNKFKKIALITKYWTRTNWNYYNWIFSGQNLITAILLFFLMYLPLIKFLNKELTLGTLVFIYTTYGLLLGPLYSFINGMRDFFRVMSDFQALFEYNKIKSEVKDLPNAKELKIKQGSIEFKNVNFKYGNRKIFEDFNLKIPKNKKVAFVGHSGSGKSTLIKLIYRFYDVDSGEILVDNKNIKNFKQESLRSDMSIVPQECILFNDTLYNNVAFSTPKASKQEVMNAIKVAQLDKIIQEFSDKENTIVGERGIKLSGGEKQRVSIARAILANKKILVLDEATSSLDSQTEYEIQADLQQLMKNRTTLIIAHRLSTIMKADFIVVIKKGKIVQKGTHAQLIKKQGEYKKLWNLQKGGYIK
ncbi:MAG: ABC transporter ATP-binding protein, partial [Candidatus Woesearchaeota archaeon]|nr:ABC transporter ATP-binding protein [Candidatus Woesearchaeota archaeon]